MPSSMSIEFSSVLVPLYRMAMIRSSYYPKFIITESRAFVIHTHAHKKGGLNAHFNSIEI